MELNDAEAVRSSLVTSQHQATTLELRLWFVAVGIVEAACGLRRDNEVRWAPLLPINLDDGGIFPCSPEASLWQHQVKTSGFYVPSLSLSSSRFRGSIAATTAARRWRANAAVEVDGLLLSVHYVPTPILGFIIDVQPKELGIPTKAYYAVEEVKEKLLPMKLKKLYAFCLLALGNGLQLVAFFSLKGRAPTEGCQRYYNQYSLQQSMRTPARQRGAMGSSVADKSGRRWNFPLFSGSELMAAPGEDQRLLRSLSLPLVFSVPWEYSGDDGSKEMAGKCSGGSGRTPPFRSVCEAE
nr:26S proteasome non-ATPase regulatory subunit 7 homolog A [Ipomoea batatas]